MISRRVQRNFEGIILIRGDMPESEVPATDIAGEGTVAMRGMHLSDDEEMRVHMVVGSWSFHLWTELRLLNVKVGKCGVTPDYPNRTSSHPLLKVKRT